LCATCRSVVATTDKEAYIHQFEEFHQCPALKDHKAKLVLPTADTEPTEGPLLPRT
jgi:hypothetical protein